MAITQTTIWNRALAHIGSRPVIVTPATDTSDEAVALQLAWETVYEPFLKATDWRWLTRYSDALTAITASDSPFTSLPYWYAVPADVLKLRFVVVPGTQRPREPYPFERWTDGTEDAVFATNVDEACICYTYRPVTLEDIIEDTVPMPAIVAKALELELAADIAMPLTKSLQLKQTLQQEAFRALEEARRVEYDEGVPDPAELPAQLAARG